MTALTNTGSQSLPVSDSLAQAGPGSDSELALGRARESESDSESRRVTPRRGGRSPRDGPSPSRRLCRCVYV